MLDAGRLAPVLRSRHGAPPDRGWPHPPSPARISERRSPTAEAPAGAGPSSNTTMKQRKQKAAAEALPAKQQRALASALQRRAADAESIVEFVDRTSLAGDEEEVSGELTTTDQHPADTADVAFQRELDLTVREMAEAREARAEAALQRLH